MKNGSAANGSLSEPNDNTMAVDGVALDPLLRSGASKRAR